MACPISWSIDSPMMRVADYRGYEIVYNLFVALYNHPNLLPADYQFLYNRLDNDRRPRIITDFI